MSVWYCENQDLQIYRREGTLWYVLIYGAWLPSRSPKTLGKTKIGAF